MSQIFDGIGVYRNIAPKALCDEIIKTFELLNSLGHCFPGQTQGGVDKTSKGSIDMDFLTYGATVPYAQQALEYIQKGYLKFVEQYPILNTLAPHSLNAFQVQRYRPELQEGYHAFHCEVGSKVCSERMLTYIMYLNDIDEGGETEFLYQKVRVKPTVGTVVIFPAYFTHVHRGNPVLSDQAKYIATGWFTWGAYER